jgi:hypothetical protein
MMGYPSARMLAHFAIHLNSLQWITVSYLWDPGGLSALSVLCDDVMWSGIGRVHMRPEERQLGAR